MTEAARYLFLAGACPFLFLGAAHAFATPFHPAARKGLSPSDPQLADSMTRSHPRMTKRTDMWLAWVGFNLSHSLGALVFGAFVVILGRSAGSFAEQAWIGVPFAAAVSGVYTILAARYWFRTPLIGCAISLALFLASWSTLILGAP